MTFDVGTSSNPREALPGAAGSAPLVSWARLQKARQQIWPIGDRRSTEGDTLALRIVLDRISPAQGQADPA